MGGKLTFGIEMEGGEAVVEQLTQIISLQKQITESGFGLDTPLNNAALGAERLTSGLQKVIDQMAELGKLDKGVLKIAAAESVAVAAPKSTATSLPPEVKPLVVPPPLPDESKHLEMALKRMMPQDKLAQSLISGKWAYTPPKSSGQQVDPQLQAWREQMSKMTPNIIIPSGGASAAGLEEERIKKVEQMLGHAVGIVPDWMRKQQEEAAKVGGTAPMDNKLDMRAAEKEAAKREMDDFRRSDYFKAQTRRKEIDHAKFMKDMTFAIMPLLNPGSVWGTLFGARQLFSAFMTETGQEKIGKFGFKGVGGAAGAMAAVMTGLTAVGLALKGFGTIVRDAGKAVGDGMRLYSKSLMSGLGLGYTTQRSIAAGLLGVPENELLRFGTALAWLQPKIAEVSRTMAQNAIPLATLSVEWNIFKLKLEAFAGTLAVRFKPALDKVMNSITEWLQAVSSHLDVAQIAKSIGAIGESLVKLVPIIIKVVQGLNVAIALQSFLTGKIIDGLRIFKDGLKIVFTALGDLLGVLMAKINNFLISQAPRSEKIAAGAGSFGLAGLFASLFLTDKKNQQALGMTQIDTQKMMQGFFDDMSNLTEKTTGDWDKLFNGDSFNALTDAIKALFGIATDQKNKATEKDKNLLPPPLTMMKQLPVSAFERMGLVIAGGHNQALDYARRTSNAVETIARHITNSSTGSTIPRANQFNLSPFVTNP